MVCRSISRIDNWKDQYWYRGAMTYARFVDLACSIWNYFKHPIVSYVSIDVWREIVKSGASKDRDLDCTYDPEDPRDYARIPDKFIVLKTCTVGPVVLDRSLPAGRVVVQAIGITAAFDRIPSIPIGGKPWAVVPLKYINVLPANPMAELMEHSHSTESLVVYWHPSSGMVFASRSQTPDAISAGDPVWTAFSVFLFGDEIMPWVPGLGQNPNLGLPVTLHREVAESISEFPRVATRLTCSVEEL